MNFPKKWRDCVDPFKLEYSNFKLKEIIGYPHAGNDVFYAKGIYKNKEEHVFIKVNRQNGADVANEINILNTLQIEHIPVVIDYGKEKTYMVTIALNGERLSTIVGDNLNLESLSYMKEFGKQLAVIHNIKGDFPKVKDRSFFHVADKDKIDSIGIKGLYEYLIDNEPKEIHYCFCHGDFHYANLLWENNHISGILDFELAGIGNRDFDIAWSIIRRPCQTFMRTKEEIDLYFEGYNELGSFNKENVIYYMVLIYSRFYFLGDEEYKEFIKDFITRIIM